RLHLAVQAGDHVELGIWLRPRQCNSECRTAGRELSGKTREVLRLSRSGEAEAARPLLEEPEGHCGSEQTGQNYACASCWHCCDALAEPIDASGKGKRDRHSKEKDVAVKRADRSGARDRLQHQPPERELAESRREKHEHEGGKDRRGEQHLAI